MMLDANPRVDADRPSCPTRPDRPFGVFPVHHESLVERPDIVDRGNPNQQCRALESVSLIWCRRQVRDWLSLEQMTCPGSQKAQGNPSTQDLVRRACCDSDRACAAHVGRSSSVRTSCASVSDWNSRSLFTAK